MNNNRKTKTTLKNKMLNNKIESIYQVTLTTSLELFVATEAIREGRRILDNHLGIVETSTLHV